VRVGVPPNNSARYGARDAACSCVGIEEIAPLEAALEAAGIPFTKSQSGRPAIFFRDPDANTVEVGQALGWKDGAKP
jgi:glyoxylase I family protein